jgi:hypothetical protein
MLQSRGSIFADQRLRRATLRPPQGRNLGDVGARFAFCEGTPQADCSFLLRSVL